MYLKLKRVLFICISVVLIFVSTNGFSQQYKTGLGVRLGNFTGFTIKHFTNNLNPIEGLLSFRWNGFIVTGLYEYQKPINSIQNLDWFVGIGGHVGFWNNDNYYYHDNNNSYTVFGVDFIGGLEYTFKEVPFTVGLDWKPAFNIVCDNHFWGDGFALSIRYNIK